ncbi:MAG: hypothetical protein NC127_09635 [Muribaculum sp.]|nr:hypothetical protein [Muribaculum sp.]
MENRNQILRKEENMMESLRETIPQVVIIRLKAMKILKELQQGGAEHEMAAEELNDAVDALSKAETAMGCAHQNLLVSHTIVTFGE